MKKFLSLLLLFGSLSVFAGNPTCRVYGSKNNAVATLERTTVSSPNINSLGTPMITGSISLTKKGIRRCYGHRGGLGRKRTRRNNNSNDSCGHQQSKNIPNV